MVWYILKFDNPTKSLQYYKITEIAFIYVIIHLYINSAAPRTAPRWWCPARPGPRTRTSESCSGPWTSMRGRSWNTPSCTLAWLSLSLGRDRSRITIWTRYLERLLYFPDICRDSYIFYRFFFHCNFDDILFHLFQKIPRKK